jgi:hypothetical protein
MELEDFVFINWIMSRESWLDGGLAAEPLLRVDDDVAVAGGGWRVTSGLILDFGFWMVDSFRIQNSAFKISQLVRSVRFQVIIFLTESERSGERLLKAARRVSESESIYRISRTGGRKRFRVQGAETASPSRSFASGHFSFLGRGARAGSGRNSTTFPSFHTTIGTPMSRCFSAAFSTALFMTLEIS